MTSLYLDGQCEDPVSHSKLLRWDANVSFRGRCSSPPLPHTVEYYAIRTKKGVCLHVLRPHILCEKASLYVFILSKYS